MTDIGCMYINHIIVVQFCLFICLFVTLSFSLSVNRSVETVNPFSRAEVILYRDSPVNFTLACEGGELFQNGSLIEGGLRDFQLREEKDAGIYQCISTPDGTNTSLVYVAFACEHVGCGVCVGSIVARHAPQSFMCVCSFVHTFIHAFIHFIFAHTFTDMSISS